MRRIPESASILGCLASSIATTVLVVGIVGCGSGNPSSPGVDGGGNGGSNAQVRFLYQTDWNGHLGCTSISDYRIQFGAIPVPVSVTIETTMPGALGPYATVDGRTYLDADVLHLYTCDGTTDENYGRFGIDLPLAPSKRYTVTLSGAAATIAEDP